MNRRKNVRYISFAAALLVCFVGALIACFKGAQQYENRINAETARALGAAVDAVGELDLSLRKSACVMTPVMEDVICADIYSNAKQVETAFSVLPVRSSSLEEMAKHVSVVGDYAAMLSRANAGGERLSDGNLKQLAQFSDTTSKLHDALIDLQQQISSGTIASERFRRITDALDNLEPAAASAAATMESQMESISKQFPNVPALVYDGVYTDKSQQTPKALEGLAPCTEEEALSAASEWLGCAASELHGVGTVEAQIPYYGFERNESGHREQITITTNGAKTLWFLSEGSDGDAVLSQSEAENAAREFLEKHGLASVEVSDTVISGGEATVRFAGVADHSVLCSPDEIEVTVSLSDGAIRFYDASKYLMHQTKRDLNVFESGSERATAAIPTFLSIQSVRPVVLEGIGDNERYCWLFICRDSQDSEYRIYVNAETDEQEQILLPEEL